MVYPKLILYHYTSGQGVVGILDSKQVWATNIHCLNDSKEFVHALSLAKLAIRQVLEEEIEDEFEVIYAAVEVALDSISQLSVYVSCYSEVSDSLSQWRGYCPPGFGYSIGFDGDALRAAASRQGFELGRCIYDKFEQENICLSWARATVQLIKRELKRSDEIVKVVQDASNTFLNTFYAFAPLLKHESFHSESEWRLFGLVRSDDVRLRIRPSKSMLVGYLAIDLDLDKTSDMIWNIMIGPTPHQELAAGTLSTYFNRIKVRNGISYSETPYRDW